MRSLTWGGVYLSCRCRKTCWLGLRQMGISQRGIFLYLIFYSFMCRTISILIRLNWAKALWKWWKCDFMWYFYECLWSYQLNSTWKLNDFTSAPCFHSVWSLWGHATWSRAVMAAEPHWQARLQWLKVNSQWGVSIPGQVRLKPAM